MFNEFKNLKKVKALDFGNIDKLKANAKENRIKLAEKAYERAWEELQKFREFPNAERLKESAYNLIQALKYNNKHIKSYYCLAFIFYALQDPFTAFEYLELGEKIAKILSPKMQNFKDKILSPLVKKDEAENEPKRKITLNLKRPVLTNSLNKINALKQTQVKAVVNKESNFVKVMKENVSSDVVLKSRLATKAYQQYIATPPEIPVYRK